MKKIKARLLRGFHCLFYTLKFDIRHRAIDITTKDADNIFETTNYVGCECGKHWYSDESGKELLNHINNQTTKAK